LVGGVSLRVKIVGIALAMIGLLGLALTWQVRVTMARVLTWELQQRGISIADDFADHSVDLIATNDMHGLHELTQDTVSNDEDVQYAFVLDPQGEILSNAFDGDLPTDLLEASRIHPDQRVHLETLQTEEGTIEDVVIRTSEGHGGIARVGLSHRRLDRTLAGVTRQILLTTLLVSMLGVIISTALTWLFTQPVLGLAAAIRKVAEGDLNQGLTPWADDEIGQAQAHFNAMVERLARSRREAEASNRRLLRRNRELSALNAISRAVAGPLGLTEVLERALQQAVGMVSASGGWVCLLGQDDFCQICVRAGEPAQANIGLDHCRRCPICRQAARSHQPLVVKPLPAECPLHAFRDAERGSPIGHIAVPLLVKEQVVGLLNLICQAADCDRLEIEDLDLLAAVGRQLGIAIENARLWEELRRKEALRGHLLRKVITAQEEERRRIARELHDEAGQALTSLLIGLRAMGRTGSLEQVQALAADLRKVVTQTLDGVHELALELRPSVLDDLGLVPALARYVQSCPARFGFQVDFVTAKMDEQRLPQEAETTLYRITQEALTNVARHANAGHISVLLERRRGAVVLVVEDDGQGFDVAQVMASPHRRERLGLYGIEERASLAGGQVTVESSPDAGTTITVEIPLEAAWLKAGRAKDPIENRRSAS
nr:GAF domain-containing protein [Anaerolineae bacterium]